MANKRTRSSGRTNSRNYSGNRKGYSSGKKRKKSGSKAPMILVLLLAAVIIAAVFVVKTRNNAEKAFASLDRSSVTVTRKGAVTVTSVESFDKDYYDFAELQKHIDAELADYNAGGEKVSQKKILVENGMARLVMQYDSVKDYVDFNSQDMAYETLEDAENAGYDFSRLSGKKDAKDDTKTFGEGTAQELKKSKVIIITEPMDVTAPYDILYCSDNLSVKSPKEAEYTGDITENDPGILILEH